MLRPLVLSAQLRLSLFTNVAALRQGSDFHVYDAEEYTLCGGINPRTLLRRTKTLSLEYVNSGSSLSTWAGVIAGKTWTLEPITIASPILSAHRRLRAGQS